MGADDLARSALQDATVAPRRAQAKAIDALRSARASKDFATASVASRAFGVAGLQLRDVVGAVRALRASARYAELADQRTLVGEARMSLAAALVVRGRPAAAMREIGLALDDLKGLAAARGLVQRAAVLQDLGRFDEALADVRRALPTLRRAGDAQWETRARSNRGLLNITRRSFRAAEVDLTIARRLCTEHKLELPRAYVEHNLGWLHSSRRDVVPALEHFRQAETTFGELGMQVGSLYADRAELLLAVRLLAEAREAAEAAVEAHRRQRRRLQIPEAQLLLSTVALVQGDLATAERSAVGALRGYRQLGKPDGVALARFARLQSQIAANPTAVLPARARRSAEELAGCGWALPALEARIAAGMLALDRGDERAAHNDLSAAARVRFAGPAELRARGWFAEARLRLAQGRRRSARSAIGAGLRVIDDYQATLEATELRAHVSGHRDELARLGLRIAIEDRAAGQVLAFVERTRASALRRHSVRPPDDRQLSEALADLRMTVSEIEERRRAGRPASELAKRRLRLERSIVDQVRRTPTGQAWNRRPVAVADIADVIGDAVLVAYVELDSALHAVTVARGRVRLSDLGPASFIHRQTSHLGFALRRLAAPRTDEAGRKAALAVIATVGRALDDSLLAPLAPLVRDRPLVLVPADPMQTVPWSLLPSCVGRPVTVSPSVGLWWQAVRRAPPDPAARTVVAAGPTLAGAAEEARVVSASYPDALVLTGSEASVEKVTAAMDGAGLVHLAAHGRLRSDNPLFSSLLMADGPLTVYELENLHRPPQHVILAACEAGRSHVVTRDEVWGLAAALLGQGTASLIAPVISVFDEATVAFMRDYHARLCAGRAPAEALAASQENAARGDPAGWAAAVPFVCLGDGLSASPARTPMVGGLEGNSVYLPGSSLDPIVEES